MADLGEDRAFVHPAIVFRQAQRDAMTPALRCQRVRSDRSHLLMRNDLQAAARIVCTALFEERHAPGPNGIDADREDEERQA